MVEAERERTVGGAEGSAPGMETSAVADPGSARGHGRRMKKSRGEEKKGWRKGTTCDVENVMYHDSNQL
jgi:hypothetical protein